MSINMERVAELTEIESKRLNERTKGSGDMYNRARNSLSGGVASSYQLREPWPIYLERGQGPKVWDVDGNEMWDFHNGFGSMVQGHAHPAIGRAVGERFPLGTHFAAPTEDSIVVGDELVTSGLDGVYPPGLPVAKVARVDKLADTAFARVTCAPLAAVRGARPVFQSTISMRSPRR